MNVLHGISRGILLLIVVSVAAVGVTRADVKIKSRSTTAGHTSESVTYIKGKRQRSEQRDSATIMQCDLKRSLQLNIPNKTYSINAFATGQASEKSNRDDVSRPQPAQPTQRGGVITSTVTSTDTGERKQFFGFTARHLKTSIVTESSPNACNPTRTRMETDGWYIDLAFALDCDSGIFGGYVPPTRPGGCRDEYRTKQIGSVKTGYPVLVTTTMFDDKGNASFSFTQEVVELTQTPLDAALFEPPADFREVSTDELYGMNAVAQGAKSAAINEEGTSGTSGAPSSSSAATVEATAPKKAGVVRVGVAIIQAVAAGNLTSAELSGALRDSLARSLASSTVEAIALTSESQQDFSEEARRKQCDFVLFVAATHKKGGGGGFGGFLKKAAPLGGLGPVTSDAASGAGGVYSAESVAADVKSKDELSLDYTLQRTGATTVVVSSTAKAKAKRDGEDLVTPVSTQTATAVLGELAK